MKSARRGMLTKYVLRLRTHEWAEHQAVSLLDVEEIGKKTIIALWKIGVTTAQAILESDPHDLAERLRPYGVPHEQEGNTPEQIVASWQEQIAALWKVRQGRLPEPAPKREPSSSRLPRLF